MRSSPCGYFRTHKRNCHTIGAWPYHLQGLDLFWTTEVTLCHAWLDEHRESSEWRMGMPPRRCFSMCGKSDTCTSPLPHEQAFHGTLEIASSMCKLAVRLSERCSKATKRADCLTGRIMFYKMLTIGTPEYSETACN